MIWPTEVSATAGMRAINTRCVADPIGGSAWICRDSRNDAFATVRTAQNRNVASDGISALNGCPGL